MTVRVRVRVWGGRGGEGGEGERGRESVTEGILRFTKKYTVKYTDEVDQAIL